jgi:hypothetical protein
MAASMIKTIRRNVKSYTLTSVGASSFDNDGYGVDAAGSGATVSAHIQPAGDKDLRNMAEGQNTLQWIVIWSEVNLPVKHKVTYGGIVYTIQKTQYWDDGGFYRAMAVFVDD